MPRGKKNPAGNDSISAMRGTGYRPFRRVHGALPWSFSRAGKLQYRKAMGKTNCRCSQFLAAVFGNDARLGKVDPVMRRRIVV